MENLLTKYFLGEASKSEVEEVINWRNASEDNSRQFFEFKTIWTETERVEKPDPSILHSILHEENLTLKVVPIWQSKYFRFAASLLIALGLVFTIYQTNQSSDDSHGFSSLSSMTLPDGTHVHLYKGASVQVGDFTNIRQVELKGKAYFDVVRDESKPFIILTESTKVEVLGTSFVVNAAEDSDIAQVMVESGTVAFSARENETVEKLILTKGEKGSLVNEVNIMEKSNIDDDNFLAWKTHNISFKKSSLGEVSRILEDVYDISIDFENENLEGCLLTATFNEKRIDEVVKIISETFNLKSQRSKNTITFAGSGCQ
ncbi:MAG: transmembrane sensor [Cyclobacteriaceae bacterium]|jgi:transmembrane sensor